jgi:PAS domain S-box-containing protein
VASIPAQLLEHAINVNREGIVITDSLADDEPIIYVNEGFERITGYRAEEVVGKNCRFLQGPQTDTDEAARIRRALEEGAEVAVEILNYRKDGGTFWNLISITPIYNSHGQVAYRIGVQMDVTRRRQSEAALRQTRDALERRVQQRTSELNEANLTLRAEVQQRRVAQERLLENQAHLRKLASELSSAEDRQRRRIASDLHDRLSQGLVAAKLKLEALVEAEAGSSNRDGFDQVLESLSELVEETRSVMFDLCPPMLYDLGLSAAVEEYTRHFAQNTGLECEFVDDGEDKPLSGELRSFLYRAIRELLLNVSRHAQAGRAVVSLSRATKTVRISVEDDGVGFKLEQIDTAHKRGHHFGLYNVRERLSYFGGWMLQESEPGKGSCVTMIVPIQSTDAPGLEVEA